MHKYKNGVRWAPFYMIKIHNSDTLKPEVFTILCSFVYFSQKPLYIVIFLWYNRINHAWAFPE